MSQHPSTAKNAPAVEQGQVVHDTVDLIQEHSCASCIKNQDTQPSVSDEKVETKALRYKGQHRPGSRKGKAHALYLSLGAIKAKPLIMEMGITRASVDTWFSEFRRAAGGGDA
jgi:hypothetical protein